MRLSRWGRSSYETAESVAHEAAALAGVVQVLPDGQDAEIVVVNSKRHVDAGFLAGVPSCRLVVTASSGHDHLDLAALAGAGVRAARLPLARAGAVTDTAIGMLLAGLRGLGPLQAAARQGRWERPRLGEYGLGTVSGRRVGVVGAGVIGQRVVGVLRALGAEVWACDPLGTPQGVHGASVEEMFDGCAAVSLHCALTPQTRGLVDEALLRRARGLILVNTARGAIVDVAAARAALAQGQLAALGLDVFPTEPPADLGELARDPRVWVTPHAAGFHDRLLDDLAQELADAVGAFVAGEALAHPVVG